jgi:hypothetical protein
MNQIGRMIRMKMGEKEPVDPFMGNPDPQKLPQGARSQIEKSVFTTGH